MKKVAALLITLALILGLCACAQTAAASWQEQYDLGVRYLSEGNYREAIIAFNAAIEIDPKRAEAYIGLADAYEAQGDVERARQVLADALAVVTDPEAVQSRLDGLGTGAAPETTAEPAQGHTWQEQYDLGVRHLSEGNYREAIPAFTAAIEIDPKRADAYIGRGQAYVLSGETEENLAAAQADFEKAIELDPTLAGAWLGLADVYIRRGDIDKALEVLREGLEKTNGDQSIADKIAELESGNIKDSSGNLRRLSHFNENGALVWYHEYAFDEAGRQASVTHRDGAGNQLGHIDFVYDNNGNRLVDYNYFIEDGTLFNTEREYDDSGKLIKETHYFDKEGDLWDYFIYQYDANGNKIRWDCYRPDGTNVILDYYRVFEYNSNGNMTKYSDYGVDGSLLRYTAFEYSSDGKLLRFSDYDCFDGNEMLSRYVIHRYNEQGRLIGADTYDGDGNLQYSESYES